MTVEVKADWMTFQDVVTPTTADLNEVLTTTGPVNARLPDATATSNTVAVARATIALLTLVHPLLRSQFLTPVNACHLISAWANSLILESRVTPLLHWLRA